MTQQIETATIVGTIGVAGAGNASITITSARMAAGVSPKTISVAVANNDTATQVAGKVIAVLALDSDVAYLFQVGGSGPNVTLTRWISEANDTTLNIASANGTCSGLTAQPTSTHTQTGSGLTNAYCTLDQYKGFQRITSVDATDDVYITLAINGASRWIDRESKTNFYGATQTRLLDTPKHYDGPLVLDRYLLSVTTLTNGDGTILTAGTSGYYLMPATDLPITAIGLYRTAARWTLNANGESVQAISLAGVWGYAASAPDDITLACMDIAKALYSRRFGENMNTKTIITPAGVVQIPEGVPDMAAQTIAKYVRAGVG